MGRDVARARARADAVLGRLVLGVRRLRFGWDYDFFADGSKARRLGFHRHVETEQMFLDIFRDLRARKVIP